MPCEEAAPLALSLQTPIIEAHGVSRRASGDG